MRFAAGVQWAGIAQSVLRLATDWNIRRSNGEEKAFAYSSRPALESTQLALIWIPGLFPTPIWRGEQNSTSVSLLGLDGLL